MSAEFKPFKGFSFKTSFAVDVSSSEWDSYTDNIKTGWGRQNNGLASSGKYNNYTWLNENVLNYEFSIKNQHNFKVLLGNSNNANTYSQTYASGSDFLNNSIIHTVNGANYLTDGGSSKSEWAIASFFGRIMYDLNINIYLQPIFVMMALLNWQRVINGAHSLHFLLVGVYLKSLSLKIM